MTRHARRLSFTGIIKESVLTFISQFYESLFDLLNVLMLHCFPERAVCAVADSMKSAVNFLGSHPASPLGKEQQVGEQVDYGGGWGNSMEEELQ